MVELGLPFTPPRGSNTTKTIPLPCPCWLPAAGGASVTSGKLSPLLPVTARGPGARGRASPIGINHHETNPPSPPLLAAGGRRPFGDVGKPLPLAPGHRAVTWSKVESF